MKTIEVKAGGDVQAAIDTALPGDEISLEAGATFQGEFSLPDKHGSAEITIRSSALDRLPPAGTRVAPEQAGLMPRVLASGGRSAFATRPAAKLWRLLGLEAAPVEREYVYALVSLGTDHHTRAEEVPHHITLERCYIHGLPEQATRRGIALNSSHTDVLDCYLSDFKEQGVDTQAIMGWTGLGNYRIVNNYLEAAGENILFGGGTHSITGGVPSDIQILNNHLNKPRGWMGSRWQVKNLLQLKSARRVRIEGNLLENTWGAAQTGMAVLLTVRGEGGAMPWAEVTDVDFINNVVRDCGGGIQILGKDYFGESGLTQRLRIENNLCYGIKGNFLEMTESARDIALVHNTVDAAGGFVVVDAQAVPGFVLRDNIAADGYGVIARGTAEGKDTIALVFPASDIMSNVMVRPDNPHAANAYPAAGFRIPADRAAIRFRDTAAGDYRLGDDSPYKGAATDNTDIGVDFAVLERARAGAQVSPQPKPIPQPTPQPTPQPAPKPEPTPQPQPQPTPEPMPEPKPVKAKRVKEHDLPNKREERERLIEQHIAEGAEIVAITSTRLYVSRKRQ